LFVWGAGGEGGEGQEAGYEQLEGTFHGIFSGKYQVRRLRAMDDSGAAWRFHTEGH
jgi:hypothetical protein